MKIKYSIISILISLVSCDQDPFESMEPAVEIIKITREGEQDIFADGRTIERFIVELDSNLNKAFQNVRIKADKGLLLGSEDGTLSQSVNKNGFLQFEWIVPDSAGLYYIHAEIGEGEDVKVYKNKVAVNVKEIDRTVKFDLSKETGLAISSTTFKLVASINTQLPKKYHSLVFKTTTGEFIGTGGTTEREVEVDQNGKVELFWKAGMDSGKHYISVEIAGVSNSKIEKEIKLEALKPYFTLELQGADEILADGASIVRIKIDSARNISNNRIKLELSSGNMINAVGSPISDGSLIVSSGKASAYIRVGSVSKDHFIRAQTESGDFFQSISFKPKRAFPEHMFVETSKNADGEYNISVFLKRTSGKVTIGTPVNFAITQVIDSETVTVGKFTGLRDAFSDLEEKVTVSLKLNDDIDSTIPIELKIITLKNSNGDTLEYSENL